MKNPESILPNNTSENEAKQKGIAKDEQNYQWNTIEVYERPLGYLDTLNLQIGIRNYDVDINRNNFRIKLNCFSDQQRMNECSLTTIFLNQEPINQTQFHNLKTLMGHVYLRYLNQNKKYSSDEEYLLKTLQCTENIEKALDEAKNPKILKISNDVPACGYENCRKEVQEFLSNHIIKSKKSTIVFLGRHKFDKIFTRIMKNKLFSINPLFKKLEMQNQLLTEMENKLIQKISMKKQEDEIKRNIIVIQSEILKQTGDEQNNVMEIKKSKSMKLKKSEIMRLPDTIMLLNDSIFNQFSESMSDYHDTENKKRNIMNLNNSLFVGLKKDRVNKILNRKYTDGPGEKNDNFIRIPTRKTNNKLKSLRSQNNEIEEYKEIILKNLISAVAEKKRLEYIERSKICWKVFNEFEETMQKAKILNFSPPNSSKETPLEKCLIDEKPILRKPSASEIKSSKLLNKDNFNKTIPQTKMKLKQIHKMKNKISTKVKAKTSESISRKNFTKVSKELKKNYRNEEIIYKTPKSLGKMNETMEKRNGRMPLQMKKKVRLDRNHGNNKISTELQPQNTSKREKKNRSWTNINISKKGKEDCRQVKKRKGRLKNEKYIPLSRMGSEFFRDSFMNSKIQNMESICSQEKRCDNEMGSPSEKEKKSLFDKPFQIMNKYKESENSSCTETKKSKIPILGTPTSIVKQIEEIVAEDLKKAETNKKIQETEFSQNGINKKENESILKKNNQKSTRDQIENEEEIELTEKDHRLEKKKITFDVEIFEVNDCLTKKCENVISDEILNKSKLNEEEQNTEKKIIHTHRKTQINNQKETNNIKSNYLSFSSGVENIPLLGEQSTKNYESEANKENENELGLSNNGNVVPRFEVKECNSEGRDENEIKRNKRQSNPSQTNLKNIPSGNIFVTCSELPEAFKSQSEYFDCMKVEEDSVKTERILNSNEEDLKGTNELKEELKDSKIGFETYNLTENSAIERNIFVISDTNEKLNKFKPSTEIKNYMQFGESVGINGEKIKEFKNIVSENSSGSINKAGENKNLQNKNSSMTDKDIVSKKRLIDFDNKTTWDIASSIDRKKNKNQAGFEEKTDSPQYDKMKKEGREEKNKDIQNMKKTDPEEKEKAVSPSVKYQPLSQQSTTDNVIVIQPAQKLPIKNVESTPGITKSFLKQMKYISDKTPPILNTLTRKKCREIVFKLKKSQENFLHNIPSHAYKIRQQVKKIRNNLPKLKIIVKKSQEIIKKIEKLNSDIKPSQNPDQLEEKKKLLHKKENKVNSLIESKVITKMKMLKKPPKIKNGTFKKCTQHSELENKKFKYGKLSSQKPSISSSSISENIEKQSVGSLFSDTVGTALVTCGGYDEIIKKYSNFQYHSLNLKYNSFDEKKTVDLCSSIGEMEIIPRNSDEYLINNNMRQVGLQDEQNEKIKKNENDLNCSEDFLNKSEENIKEICRNRDLDIYSEKESSELPVSKINLSDHQDFEALNNKNRENKIYLNQEVNLPKTDALNLQTYVKSKRNIDGEMSQPYSSRSEEIIMLKNNETFIVALQNQSNGINIKKIQSNLPSDRGTRITESSTGYPPAAIENDPYTPHIVHKSEAFVQAQEETRSLNFVNSQKKIDDNEVVPEVFFTPQTSNTDFTRITDVDERIFIRNMPTSTSMNQISPLSNEKYIDALNFQTNSDGIICMEKGDIEKKNSIGAILKTCENEEKHSTSDCTKEKNLKEKFPEPEVMKNCNKIYSSMEDLSTQINPDLNIHTNNNRGKSLATPNSEPSYLRFSVECERANKKDKDLEELEEIRSEALEHEHFFRKKCKNQTGPKAQTTNTSNNESDVSIYRAIVRMCEIEHFDLKRSKEFEQSNCERNFSKTQKNYEKDIVKNPNSHESEIRVTKTATNSKNNEKISDDSGSMTGKKSHKLCCIEPVAKEEFFEKIENSMLKIIKSCDYNEKISKNFCGGIEKLSGDECSNSFKTPVVVPEKKKAHKILKKFAMIKQDSDSNIFRINNEIKFDRTKKRMCQIETTSRRQLKSNISTQGDVENPRMIMHLSPSEDFIKQSRYRNRIIDLKKILIENPKSLMYIASNILSRNQYLKFLLELKSTKELKDSWINKIKEGINSSKTLQDLSKFKNFIKFQKKIEDSKKHSVAQETDNDDAANAEQKECTNNEDNQHSTTKLSKFCSTKSDAECKNGGTNLELETKSQRPKTGQSNQRKNKILNTRNGQDTTNRRNLSLQHKQQHGNLEIHLDYIEIDTEKNKVETKSSEIQNLQMENKLLKKITQGSILTKGKHEGDDTIANKSLGNISIYREIETKNEGISKRNLKNNQETISSAVAERKGNMKKNTVNMSKKLFLNKKHQTAIVLPGRAPIKLSLMSDVSQPTTSTLNKSKNSVLDNLSDVLCNCKNPIPSKEKNIFESEERPPQISLFETSKSFYKSGNLTERFCSGKNSSNNKINDLVEDIEYGEKAIESRNAEHSNIEERKIRVVRTKSLSEILKDDPEALKRYRQSKQMKVNKGQSEDMNKKLEYRFHDFRKKYDKISELKAKRAEEHKKDLLDKFKNLIQARRMTANRNKQNIKSHENSVGSRDFSKIFGKTNYFKDSETNPKSEKYTSGKNSLFCRDLTKNNMGNWRYMSSKKQKIDEEELVTLVQKQSDEQSKNSR